MKSKLVRLIVLLLPITLNACVVVPARPVYVEPAVMVAPAPVVVYGRGHYRHRW